MRNSILLLTFVLLAAGCAKQQAETTLPQQEKEKKMITVTSPAFQDGGTIPVKFTCKGENINPELRFDGIPHAAKSLVLIVDDPDAPNGTFTHWVVFNISPTTTSIPENSVPAGAVQAANGAGKAQYMGPCPPSGTHRYYFKVYALDGLLPLEPGTTRAEVEAAMQGRVIDQGELMGTFGE